MTDPDAGKADGRKEAFQPGERPAAGIPLRKGCYSAEALNIKIINRRENRYEI